MHVPSVAAWYACGRFAATPYRRCKPSSSTRKIEHNIPSLWASIRRVIVVRTSFRGAPRSIIFNASSTASPGSICAGDGDVGSACRLGDAVAFAINRPLVSRDASSIAQTHVQHLIANLASSHALETYFVKLGHPPCVLLDSNQVFRPCS